MRPLRLSFIFCFILNDFGTSVFRKHLKISLTSSFSCSPRCHNLFLSYVLWLLQMNLVLFFDFIFGNFVTHKSREEAPLPIIPNNDQFYYYYFCSFIDSSVSLWRSYRALKYIFDIMGLPIQALLWCLTDTEIFKVTTLPLSHITTIKIPHWHLMYRLHSHFPDCFTNKSLLFLQWFVHVRIQSFNMTLMVFWTFFSLKRAGS